MQLDRHPLNSRSKFSSTIDINNLNFLSDDSLEVAIKSIILDTDASHNVIESVSEIPDIVLVHKINIYKCHSLQSFFLSNSSKKK